MEANFFGTLTLFWDVKHIIQIKFQRPKNIVTLKSVGVYRCVKWLGFLVRLQRLLLQISSQNYLLCRLF
jgi:hypothetical protein